MVSRYEALLLTVPEITADESRTIEDHIDRIIKGVKGSIISFEKWGKYKLAYPVRKYDYGTYFLVRFESEAAAVEEVKSIFAVKYHELVMRNMIIQLAPKQSLVYQKPPSLEDAPARDVSTFLKENRMDGFMGGAESSEDAFEDDEE